MSPQPSSLSQRVPESQLVYSTENHREGPGPSGKAGCTGEAGLLRVHAGSWCKLEGPIFYLGKMSFGLQCFPNLGEHTLFCFTFRSLRVCEAWGHRNSVNLRPPQGNSGLSSSEEKFVLQFNRSMVAASFKEAY